MEVNQPEQGNELFIAFKRRERDADRQVFDRYSNRLFYLALKITGSREEAQDIVQETFIKLIGRRSALENFQNLEGFLVETTKNAALNFVEREKKKHSVGPMPGDIPTHDENIVEKEMYRAWLLGEMHKEIEKLPKGRKAVLKQYLQGKSTAEIAALLDLNPQTVLNHKSDAIKQLIGRLPKDALLMICLLLSVIKD
jgi:RNA polymerase sigma factor (sigma-70 family)